LIPGAKTEFDADSTTAEADSVLVVRDLSAGYGQLSVLSGLELSVGRGEIVAVIGANGAGKTTLLRALSGMIPATGEVLLNGRPILGLRPSTICSRGLVHVPQGRGTFAGLTVEENLRLGAYTQSSRQTPVEIERVYDLFPLLRTRRREQAGKLSGGEQQMLALGRSLMAQPRALLLDEPSLGLSPKVTQNVYRVLGEIHRETGLAVLLVEQSTYLALGIADRGYVIANGRIAGSGSAAELAVSPLVRRAYLGA
jgi:branched-chain amino acid transport system ATP-binding protein